MGERQDGGTAPLLEVKEGEGTESGFSNSGERASGVWRVLTWVGAPFRIACDNGPFCTVVGQLFLAIMAVFIKLLSQRGVPIFEIVLFLSMSSSAVFFVMWALSGRPQIIGPQEILGLQIGRAVFAVSSTITYLAGFTFLPIGDSMALTKLAPIFAAIFAWVLRWENLNLLIFAGVVVCSGGAVLIEHPSVLFGGHDKLQGPQILGICIALSASLLFAALFLFTGRIGKRCSTTSLGIWMQFPTMITTLFPMFLGYPAPPVYSFSFREWMMIAGLSSSGVLGILLKMRGVQICNATYASTLQCSAVLFSYLLGYIVLKEAVSVYGLVGTGFIAAGVWMLTIGRQKAKLKRIEQMSSSIAEDGNEKANLLPK